MDRGNRHHNRAVAVEIATQLRFSVLHRVRPDEPVAELRHENLLIDARHEYFFVNRLILAPQIIMVQILIQIINPLHERKRAVCKQVVHIKRMLRKL